MIQKIISYSKRPPSSKLAKKWAEINKVCREFMFTTKDFYVKKDYLISKYNLTNLLSTFISSTNNQNIQIGSDQGYVCLIHELLNASINLQEIISFTTNHTLSQYIINLSQDMSFIIKLQQQNKELLNYYYTKLKNIHAGYMTDIFL